MKYLLALGFLGMASADCPSPAPANPTDYINDQCCSAGCPASGDAQGGGAQAAYCESSTTMVPRSAAHTTVLDPGTIVEDGACYPHYNNAGNKNLYDYMDAGSTPRQQSAKCLDKCLEEVGSALFPTQEDIGSIVFDLSGTSLICICSKMDKTNNDGMGDCPGAFVNDWSTLICA